MEKDSFLRSTRSRPDISLKLQESIRFFTKSCRYCPAVRLTQHILELIHAYNLLDKFASSTNNMNGQNLVQIHGQKKGYHVYNLDTGSGHSVQKIVHAVKSVSGRSVHVAEALRQAGDVGICVADMRRSQPSLQWSAKQALSRADWDIC